MKKLVNKVEKLKKTKVKQQVDKRIKQFKSNKNLFSELCFCLLTANFHAERAIKIQNKLSKSFATLPQKQLAKKLKKHGHRFPNTRASYIVSARSHKNFLKTLTKLFSETEIRDWLVKNVKGLGYKESSHFLRNIGYENFALVDFHIIDLLVRHRIIKRPKTLTPAKYVQVENKLAQIAKKTNLNQAQLDLYLWYMETGKVLK